MVFLGLLLALIAITQALHLVFGWRVEQSRKFLHVSGGLLCLLLPRFFDSHWWVLILACLAFALLLFTYLTRMLKAIHQTNRYSVGSVIFPIPVYLCFLAGEMADNFIFFYLPVSLLAIADTAAETAGNRWGYQGKQFFKGQKTLAGTMAFFFTAVFICLGWLFYFGNIGLVNMILFSVVLSLTTALTELVTLHGWDNLTVPFATIILLYIFLT
jgi:phytol kinase